MKNKYLIVTGGLGFIGFNFIQYIISKKNIENLKIIVFDCVTYAAVPFINFKLNFFKEHGIILFKDNICDYIRIENKILKFSIEDIIGIINFAAETHVDNSIKDPSVFIKSNILGTQVLLDICKKYNLRFHQISTDEVYGSVDPYNDVVDENFKYNPSSPYSSSKASADLITLSYFKTFNVKATISRCTNNYGKFQHKEKLIPLVINNIKNNISIPVYGDGKQMRNWIHVVDHCEAIWNIFHNGQYGEIYNVGSDTLITNIDLIKKIINKSNASELLIKFVKDRPAHDVCYHLCSKKIQEKLNWKQCISFNDGINNLLKTEGVVK